MNKNQVTTATLKAQKGQEPIAMLTAYDYCMAGLFDAAGVDVILVGDSLGNVVLGYSSTLPVTMDDIIHHSKAVARACRRAMIVADMPFMSYQASVEQGMINAGRLLKEGGANAVKLEGGKEICSLVEKLVISGIPVMGHLGLTPQSVNQLGGFKVQGKSVEDAQKIINEAKALAAAGIFALVLECIPDKLAAKISAAIDIPTIGIGAGNACDGQVLVCNDFLGMNSGFTPKFVKKYRLLHEQITQATREYISDVKTRAFPAQEHIFTINEEVLEKLY